MLSNVINQKINKISIFLSLLPLSFIVGNPAINANVALIIIYALIVKGKKLLKFRFLLIDKLIISFFLLSLITVLINSFDDLYLKNQNLNFYSIYKTLFFLRYAMFYFILRYYIQNKLINLNTFFITSSICVSFVCFDLFYQLYFGKDIFGYGIDHYKISGPFGKELIAGSYLQRFSLFLFFSIFFLIHSIKKNSKKLLIFFSWTIVFLCIIIAGNRMPFILFLMTLFLFVLFKKSLRKYFLLIAITFSFTLFITMKNNENIYNNFFGFYERIKNFNYLIINHEKYNPKNTPEQIFQFKSGLVTWSENKIFGGGIKSFNSNCWTVHEKINSTWSCDSHPHNYYIEILSELGLIGFFIILAIFINLILIYFKKRGSAGQSGHQNTISLILFILIFSELFIIKSTGSFFSTFNSTYIFLLLSIFVGMSVKRIHNR